MRDDQSSSSQRTRFKVLWTLWMAGGGIAATVLAYRATGNWGWAILALLASGVVLNFIGQLVVQPLMATRARHHRGGRRAAT
jgi:hypothetical protein